MVGFFAKKIGIPCIFVPMKQVSHVKAWYRLFLWLTLGFSLGVHGQERWIAVGLLNIEDTNNVGLIEIQKGHQIGANAVQITVHWDKVYARNQSANWRRIDAQVNLARSLGMKIAFRIHLSRSMDQHTPSFWPDDLGMMDFRGNPVRDGYFETIFSFAAEEAVQKGLDFVREVCTRYRSLQSQGHVLFVSVSNTGQQELGYGMGNKTNNGVEYLAVYDFSRPTLSAWRTWLREKYTTITTLNQYWNTNFTSFDQANPYIHWDFYRDSFTGERGRDWYTFRHEQLKGYFQKCVQTIRSVDPTYQPMAEVGSFTDELGVLRGTLAFKNLTEGVPLLKSNAIQPSEFDVMWSNLAPGQDYYTEIAAWDRSTSQELVEYTRRVFTHYPIKFMSFYFLDQGPGQTVKMLPAIQEAVQFKNRPVQPVIWEDSMRVTVSHWIDNPGKFEGDWNTVSQRGQKRVKVNVQEDIFLRPRKIAPVLPDPPAGTVPPPPPPPVWTGGTQENQPPQALVPSQRLEKVINQHFNYRIPLSWFFDPDGYIARLDIEGLPSWMQYLPEHHTLMGRPTVAENLSLRVVARDNRGDTASVMLKFVVIPPTITLELIKADYFDVPREGWGFINDRRTLVLDALPERTNIIATCPVDSIQMYFQLTGPFFREFLSERQPFNLFGEGRGLAWPLGNYQLHVEARKGREVVSTRQIQFQVINSVTDTTRNTLPASTVYPNPFLDICNVVLPAEIDFQGTPLVRFTDALGRQFSLPPSRITRVGATLYLDTRGVLSGGASYWLQISYGDNLLVEHRIHKR